MRGAAGVEIVLKSGNALDGIYEATITFPQFSEAGIWCVSSVYLRDFTNNNITLSQADLIDMGFSTELEVISVQDLTSPTLIGFSFSPTIINCSNSDQIVTVTMHITDDLSGYDFGSVQLKSPSGQMRGAAGVEIVLKSGNALDGIYEATITFPQFSEAGIWCVSSVYLRDFTNNNITLSQADLIDMGFSTCFNIFDRILVDIDIKPGSGPNSINLDSEGVIPIAVLGSSTFDVATVDQTTLEFQGNTARVKGKSNNIGSFENINADDFTDLVVQFPVNGLDFTEDDTEGTLTGNLKAEFGGTSFQGTDDICIVPAFAKRRANPNEANVPKQFVLHQNYPNPFNPETYIQFQLAQASRVLFRIYNSLGQEIRTVANRYFEASNYKVRWDSNG